MTSPGMPEQQVVEVPVVDVGNPLLAETPAHLACAVAQTPGGQRAVLTIRTASSTVTVFLSKQDLEQWQSDLKATRSAMTGLIVAPAPSMSLGGPIAGAGV